MHKPIKLGNESGYTLLESILQLLIMIIFIHLFVLFFFWKGTIDRSYGDYKLTEWELFSAELQIILSEVDDFNLAEKGFSFKKNTNTYQINQSGSVIRQQKLGDGHIPLLTGVQTTHFSFDGIYLTVTATMLDDTVKERSFAVGLVPK